jgi:hypothetical protein
MHACTSNRSKSKSLWHFYFLCLIYYFILPVLEAQARCDRSRKRNKNGMHVSAKVRDEWPEPDWGCSSLHRTHFASP